MLAGHGPALQVFSDVRQMPCPAGVMHCSEVTDTAALGDRDYWGAALPRWARPTPRAATPKVGGNGQRMHRSMPSQGCRGGGLATHLVPVG